MAFLQESVTRRPIWEERPVFAQAVPAGRKAIAHGFSRAWCPGQCESPSGTEDDFEMRPANNVPVQH